MPIRRSELDGTRVLEIDRLSSEEACEARGARFALTDPDDAQVALLPVFDRQRLARSFIGDGILSDGDTGGNGDGSSSPGPAAGTRSPSRGHPGAVPGLVARIAEAAGRRRSAWSTRRSIHHPGPLSQRLRAGPAEDHDRVRVILDYFDAIGGVLFHDLPGMGLDADVMASVRARRRR